jgi:hypothetical protein
VTPRWRTRLAAPLRGLARSFFRSRPGAPLWQRLKRWVDGEWMAEVDRRLFFVHAHSSPEEWRSLEKPWDDSVPLHAEATQRLHPDHPRLLELRQAYAPYL